MSVTGRLNTVARHHPHTADLAVAAVVLAVTLVTTATGAGQAQPGTLTPMTVAVALIGSGALIVRRRHPVPVLIVSAVAAEVYLGLYRGHAGTLIVAAPLIALYTVAEAASRRGWLTVGLLTILAFGTLHTVGKPASWLGAENLALAAFGVLAIVAGDASRVRRAYLAEVEERARRAEHEHEAEARRQVAEERLRIARDLHDSVGHHLALINVQAGVAAHVNGDAAATLARIRLGSRTALDELRDTVGLLRQPGEPVAPTEPTVGLAGLPDLLTSARRSGLTVRLHITGEPVPLPWAHDVAAYRVVQEALTNVCKHAGSAPAEVEVSWSDTRLSIVVADRGAPGPEPVPGNGITGMRERVSVLGGTLLAGPGEGGGFRVAAELPL